MTRDVRTLVDDLDFYVLTRDSTTAALTVTGSATTTFNGTSVQNTGPEGAIFYTTFSTVNATCTVRLNWQAEDPVSGLFITFASLSINALAITNTVGATTMQTIYISPGAVSLATTNMTVFQMPLPRVFRVQASITLSSTATHALGTLNVGYTRLGGA